MIESKIIEIVNKYKLTFPLPNQIVIQTTNQWDLKVVAYINQDDKCICGEHLYDGELHHALLSRRDVMGYHDPDIIHHSLNVILLHPHCHININIFAPS